MNSDKSKVQAVLVDVPEYDKDGNPISLDSLSSGGARNADGSLIVQYRNPRLPEAANVPEVDREFDERLRREDDALRRREEEAEERRRKEKEDFARGLVTFVIDEVAIPLAKKVVVPWATALWVTRVLPGGKRFAQRLRPKMSQSEVPQVSGDTPEFAADISNPLRTSQHITPHTAHISTVRVGGEDTPLAEVIQIDEYQKRRSA